jgi:phosphatidylglycerophosphatase A
MASPLSEYPSDSFSVKRHFQKAGWLDKCALMLATWFGAGLCPLAPGTAGTLAALPVFFLWNNAPLISRVMILFFLTGMAVWAAGRCEISTQMRDPSVVVIDEVTGFLLTMVLLPFTWLTLCLGFVFFRIFDILKPFPIRFMEKRIKGGWGVVLDDLVAGGYAFLSTKVVLLLLQAS